ncbi:hypothetical protein [Microbacterium terricola]|uniref:DUF4190 domain-containing protein n=1 Tax=Microbacterium terricola TaxID=344163 RepID=A0ABM8DW12_9MICO|nr:hypothetical protein [Microbacterium terricola]UYK39461.1 hypothetical protein OAU46_12235 [Microbacterium terricola]BDV29811.1 hypothetical protein Microterr_04710 [Microbacterium terricola]
MSAGADDAGAAGGRTEDAGASAPQIEAPSSDVEPVTDTTRLPGEHRGGFSRLPTGPVDIALPGFEIPADLDMDWYAPEPAPLRRGMAAWALGFSIAGLVVSFFVGWGFPIGLAGAVSAIIALRRPLEPRGVAIWALVLGIVSILFSIGWLLWAASRTNLFG